MIDEREGRCGFSLRIHLLGLSTSQEFSGRGFWQLGPVSVDKVILLRCSQ